MKKNLIPGIAILVVIVALGVVAFRFRSSIPFLKNSISPIPEKKEITLWPEVALQDKVVFVANGYGLGVANPDGTALQPLNEDFADLKRSVDSYLVSPDHNKVFVEASKQQKTTAFSETLETSNKYYVVSLAGTLFKEIDFQKITAEFGAEYIVDNWGWSTDSNFLILDLRDTKNLVEDAVSKAYTAHDIRISKHVFVAYDISTLTASKIYEKSARPLKLFSYNSSTKKLVFLNLFTGDEMVIADVATGAESTTPRPAHASANFSKDQLFTRFEKDQAGASVIKIYSFANPKSALGQMTDPDLISGKLQVGFIVWSPTNDRFALYLVNPAGDESSAEVRIYGKTGALLSSFSSYLQGGSLFSSDGNSLLAVKYAGKSADGFYQTSWRVGALSSWDKPIANFTTTELIWGVYWFK